MRFTIFILTFFLGLPLWAGDNFTKLQFFQVNYSGKDLKTFSSDNPGMGFEVLTSTNNNVWNWIAKGRFTTISGNQNFSDGGTNVKSAFTFYQSSFEGGFTLYPLEKKRRAANIFFGAAGIMSLNYLRLDSKSLTVLSPTYQSTSFGYEAMVGIEWYLFGAERWCMTTEFAVRNETTALAKVSSFSLNAFTLGIGIAW